MNGAGECPERYKQCPAYVNRAFMHSTNWHLVHKELERLTKVLVSNGFLRSDIQMVTVKKMSAWHSDLPAPGDKPQPIILCYKNVMSSSYREDVKAIKDIVKLGVDSMTLEQNVKLIVHYKTRKTSQLVPRFSTVTPFVDISAPFSFRLSYVPVSLWLLSIWSPYSSTCGGFLFTGISSRVAGVGLRVLGAIVFSEATQATFATPVFLSA